jgi:hypothetical protein
MEAIICEACGQPAGYKFSIVTPEKRIDIDLCKKHMAKGGLGIVTESELLYIHNCFLSGQRKPFLL